uniref:hypothetical protein n=1 Tax=Promicromonospora sp. CA-291202 TaxID=3240016 RepID=UPI003F4915AF
MSARLKRGDVVRVVAETLSNGAPHPLFRQAGVVVQVHRRGLWRVQVHIDGRPGRVVKFRPDELARNDDTPGDLSRDEMSRSSG